MNQRRAIFLIGALLGLLAVGALWYFAGGPSCHRVYDGLAFDRWVCR